MYKNMDKETFWGGVFGAVTIVATIAELIANGFAAGTVAGAIKDIFGTLVVIVLFVAVLRENRTIVYKDFENAFSAQMREVSEKYAPVICRDEKNSARYNIASRLSCIFDYNPGIYRTFFDYTENSLTFSVKKEIFMGRSKESFDATQAKIISEISSNIEKTFPVVEKIEHGKDKFTVFVKQAQAAQEEAENMASIVERVIVLYIAERDKKGD